MIAQLPASAPVRRSSRSMVVGPLSATLHAEPLIAVPGKGSIFTVTVTSSLAEVQPLAVASTQKVVVSVKTGVVYVFELDKTSVLVSVAYQLKFGLVVPPGIRLQL